MHARDAQVPVFVLGHGITQLGVLRGLAAARIPAFAVNDLRDFVMHSRFFHPLPLSSGVTPAPYSLAEFLRGWPNRAVLMPCTDEWCQAVAALSPELSAQFPSSIPPRPVVDALLDKWLLAQLLEREGVPHPRTVCLSSREDAEALPESVFAGAFLKPRASQQFSRRYKVKAFAVANREEALAGLVRAFVDGFSVILQEYVPGPPTKHYFVEGFVDRKGRASFLARRRLRMNPPRFGNSCFMESVPLGTVQGAVISLERLFASIGFRGMCDAEFKYDARDREFKLIEINCRPWWQLDFAEYCGFPICSMAYHDALGRDVPPLAGYRVGKCGVILSQDFQAYRCLRKTGELRLGGWLASVLLAHDLVFRWSDPMPAIAQLLHFHKWEDNRAVEGSKREVPA